MKRIVIASLILSFPLFVLATRPPRERDSFQSVVERAKQVFAGRITSVRVETNRHSRIASFVISPTEAVVGDLPKLANVRCKHTHEYSRVRGQLPNGPVLFSGGHWTGSGLEFSSQVGKTNIFLLGNLATSNSAAILLRVEPVGKKEAILKMWNRIQKEKRKP